MTYLQDNVQDCISSAEIALEKSDCLLNQLMNEYDFANEPTRAVPNINREAQKWLWEYKTVINFIFIIHDYAFEALKHLEQAMKCKD